jgi:citrate lyase subunit beta/citryl-CoA lyase
MIETALYVFRLEEIADAAHLSRPTCFVMGTNDLAKELHMQLDHRRTPFAALLALTVAASRAHSVALLDGVDNAFDDQVGFKAQCRQGFEYGFDGKTLIHPKQIETCNAVFSPSPALRGEVTLGKGMLELQNHCGLAVTPVAPAERAHHLLGHPRR